jgi:twitching motility protein PilT
VRCGEPAEWLLEVADVGRVRCSTFRDHRGPGANFHFAFLRATTADDLQLSAETRRLATEPDGLILVTGLAGSDAPAIVAAFVDTVNRQRADYIVTLEPQIRVQHASSQALVSQREVGTDPGRVVLAARAALREEPDVLVVDGVSSGELAQLVIQAASQDRLVIASIDAPSAPAAVRRLIDLVPEDQRPAARDQLSRCFRGAVAQLQLRKATGGRIAVRELLSSSKAVAHVLAAGDLSQLDAGGAAGSASLTDALVAQVRAGVIDVREAVRKAPEPTRLLAGLTAAGVDLSPLDGWT